VRQQVCQMTDICFHMPFIVARYSMPYPERYVLDTRVPPISMRQQLCPYTFYYVALCLCVAGLFSAKLEHCPLRDEGSFAEDFAFRVPVCMLSKA